MESKTNSADSPGIALSYLNHSRRAEQSRIDRFLRHDWRSQRIAWVVCGAVLLAAMLGVFGHGPLSYATVSDGNALKVSYERFGRWKEPARLRVTLSGSQSSAGGTIWIDREYLLRMNLQRITPEPASSRLLADRVEYTFAVSSENESGGGAGRLQVDFAFSPSSRWLQQARVGVGSSSAVSFRQFIYP